MAKYRCKQCQTLESLPRRYRFHTGARCRCPHCGTFRINKLRAPDRIDPMETGILNLLERCLGGKLYHCRFCRVQFWDRRRFVPQSSMQPAAKAHAAAPAATPRA